MGSEASETAWWPSVCDTSPTSVTDRGGSELPAAVGGTLCYTAAAIFPQCALYNQAGLLALPFEVPIE